LIPQSFIQELLTRVDIVDVVGRSVKLKKAGANYQGLCPFHNEKTPSFSVSPTKQFYHCFGCGAHGSSINFLMEHFGMGFVEAVHELARDAGLTVPEDNSREGRDAAQKASQQLALSQWMDRAAAYYRLRLKETPAAIQYLKDRGVSGETAKRFGLGYAPAGWRNLEGGLRGLGGPRELPRLWSRHIVNSAAVVPFLPARGSVADVGSGAGFPGIVVALLRPDLDVTLIETMERRTQWLSDVVEELDLDNVTIRRARAEEIKDRFDVVTARAVANLSKLVRLTAPLLRPGGALLALKGMRAQDEVDDAKYLIKKAKLSVAVVHEVVTPGDETTAVVEIRRPKNR